ncbi:MAG: preprotein translocase subunit SecY [Deltaproteobacteria bacterium]|nr:preprotein translocase subunit SecY [Deltaproteobacteria bacterium]MBW2415163.1 preprotein translocase subunit SecY [Deltaproteobacteria bacterium]
MNPGAVQNITRIPELNRRILFTFAMLGVYRVGCAIPTPGIDPEEMRRFFADAGGVLDLFNMFTGGALEQLSIFALGIMPYISSSIILQLLTVVIPRLAELKKEGEEGRRVVTRYTRYLTVILAVLQGYLMATALESGIFGPRTVFEPGLQFRLMTMITLTAGTSFIMWLGEQITERGIGNGISLVIFSGIVVSIPSALTNLYDLIRTGQLEPIGAILLFGMMIAIVGAIVHFERSQRRIPIQYARRVVGRQVVGGGMSYFPLKLNVAGVIPPIFASSLLLLPAQLGQWTDASVVGDFLSDYFAPSMVLYNVVYVGLIIFFAYFYTGVMIDPDDVAENIKKNGGYIPGIRPGQRTASYIHRVLNRTTAIGAVYLAGVCILPVLLAGQFNVPFYFGGTALLIVVGVALDTVSQVEAHLVTRSYDSFVQGVRIRGRGNR